jgi:hypothetical protein
MLSSQSDSSCHCFCFCFFLRFLCEVSFPPVHKAAECGTLVFAPAAGLLPSTDSWFCGLLSPPLCSCVRGFCARCAWRAGGGVRCSGVRGRTSLHCQFSPRLPHTSQPPAGHRRAGSDKGRRDRWDREDGMRLCRSAGAKGALSVPLPRSSAGLFAAAALPVCLLTNLPFFPLRELSWRHAMAGRLCCVRVCSVTTFTIRLLREAVDFAANPRCSQWPNGPLTDSYQRRGTGRRARGKNGQARGCFSRCEESHAACRGGNTHSPGVHTER